MPIKMIIIALLLTVLSVVGNAQAKSELDTSDYIESVGMGRINWTAGFLEAPGIGAPQERASDQEVVSRMAVADANRHLFNVIRALRLNSASTVRDIVHGDDLMTARIEGVIRGAHVVSRQRMRDNTVEVRVRLPLHGNLAALALPVVFQSAASDRPQAAGPTHVSRATDTKDTTHSSVTGLIVDARGIGARPALAPAIVDEAGRELYGWKTVDQACVSRGMTGYTRDLSAAANDRRVMGNPLTVRALKADGRGQADLVVSNDDAQKITQAQQSRHFLNPCAVIIVLD